MGGKSMANHPGLYARQWCTKEFPSFSCTFVIYLETTGHLQCVSHVCSVISWLWPTSRDLKHFSPQWCRTHCEFHFAKLLKAEAYHRRHDGPWLIIAWSKLDQMMNRRDRCCWKERSWLVADRRPNPWAQWSHAVVDSTFATLPNTHVAESNLNSVFVYG